MSKRMRAPQPQLTFERELVVDLFAGAGGASTGLAVAYREPDVAVNHDPIAIAVHRINHPNTKHYTCDVFEVDPIEATGGRPVGLLWASPDCRHHSKAKGGKPRSKRVRGLAWVVLKWAAACKPRLIHLENVEEFADWGPLLADGQPCQIRKGMTFRRWARGLEKLGYKVEHREIVAADMGAPTTRNRLYVIARRDGLPIVWPYGTHAKDGKGGREPWRTAAECIDFTLPACSIFATKPQARKWAKERGMKGTPQRPLKTNTLRRIAKGTWRYVLNHPNPFIVPLRGTSAAHTSTHGIDAPLTTVSAGGQHHALCVPVVAPNNTNNVPKSANDPVPCVTSGGRLMLAGHSLIQTSYGERKGQEPRVLDLDAPLGTCMAGGIKHSLAAAHLTKFRTGSVGLGLDEPMPTVTAGGDMARDAGAAHALGMVTAHLTHLTHQDDRDGYSLTDPARTVTGAHRGEQAIVQAAFLEQAAGGPNSNGSRPRSMREPVSTVTVKGSQQQLVNAFLVKSYSSGGQWSAADAPLGAVTTKDRMGLVTVEQVPANIIAPDMQLRAKQCADFLRKYLPEHFATDEIVDMVLVGDYVLVDITLRMLVPRELARAQGFPDTYIIDRGLFPDGTIQPITKTAQVRLIGNSVCPDVANALAAANLAPILSMYREHALSA